MAHLAYHTNYSSLAKDIISLVDEYNAKTSSETDLWEWVRTWRDNCANLLFDKGDTGTLAPTIVRHIGKKRSLVVLAALRDISK